MDDVLDVSVLQGQINTLQNSVNGISSQIGTLDTEVSEVQKIAAQTQADLNKLQEDFQTFVKEKERRDAYQRASTELVSIRQEIERKFGNNEIVRQTMLGVLQATDSKLVRQNTISRVSEELMLSTPRYWLAPVLVAVSAWIGNDRDLADRAIHEAIRRDDEKTSLTMALICRRNQRTDACFSWLSRFFAQQHGNAFSEGNMVYIDAYMNGVFGVDEKHLCDDYIQEWIEEAHASSKMLNQEQEESWKKYYSRFSVNVDKEFPALHNCSAEYGSIQNYIGRIDSVNVIRDNMQMIENQEVDLDTIRRTVDDHLLTLVRNYDDDEMDFRRQERLLMAIKAHEGDVSAARAEISAKDSARYYETVNILESMTRVAQDDQNYHSDSEKKTAMHFVRNFANQGFQSYMQEGKDSFPQQITIGINGWKGTTTDCSNAQQLHNSFESNLQQQRTMQLSELSELKKSNTLKVFTILFFIIGVVCLFAVLPLGVIALIVTAVCGVKHYRNLKSVKQKEAEIQQNYEQLSKEGHDLIAKSLEEWNSANIFIKNYEVQPVSAVL